jgi:hypothetical protein
MPRLGAFVAVAAVAAGEWRRVYTEADRTSDQAGRGAGWLYGGSLERTFTSPVLVLSERSPSHEVRPQRVGRYRHRPSAAGPVRATRRRSDGHQNCPPSRKASASTFRPWGRHRPCQRTARGPSPRSTGETGHRENAMPSLGVTCSPARIARGMAMKEPKAFGCPRPAMSCVIRQRIQLQRRT